MSLTLKLDCDPGSEIEQSFSDAQKISDRLKISVEFEFNGITCFARVGGWPQQGVHEYHEAIKSKSEFKFAGT
jgi:hypothetical protein